MIDNQSAICIARNRKVHSKTKHLDIISDIVMKNVLNLVYCPTEDMMAEIFYQGFTFIPLHQT